MVGNQGAWFTSFDLLAAASRDQVDPRRLLERRRENGGIYYLRVPHRYPELGSYQPQNFQIARPHVQTSIFLARHSLVRFTIKMIKEIRLRVN
jgi:hypothetical protein